MLDYTFLAMASYVLLLIGAPLLSTLPPPLAAADRERGYVWQFAQRLSRFVFDSDLSKLNRDPRSRVAAPPLLRAAVNAGLWAAWRSDGLVDPTLLSALERIGYDHSLDGARAASLADALRHAPAPRPAWPHPDGPWR